MEKYEYRWENKLDREKLKPLGARLFYAEVSEWTEVDEKTN